MGRCDGADVLMLCIIDKKQKNLIKMDEKDKQIEELKSEIKKLQEIINKNQKSNKSNKTSKIILFGLKAFLGKNLYRSTENIISGKIDSESIASILVNILYRFTRVGLFAILIGVIPISILIIQTILLKTQNDKIEVQNAIIKTQTSLIESTRMTSYINLIESIIKDINVEIASSATANLSSSLINRISSLTKSVRPYRYLDENDKISEKLISPERTQLLNYILNLNLNEETLSEIFRLSDFSYSTMNNSKLSNLNLNGITCIECDFSSSELKNINLKNATLYDIDLRNSVIDSSDFYNSELIAAELEWAKISNTNLGNTNLQGLVVQFAKFDNVNFDSAWVSDDGLIREYLEIDEKRQQLTDLYDLLDNYEYDNRKTYSLIRKK